MTPSQQLLLMTGNEIPLLYIQETLHQPTIEELALLGEENFYLALGLFKMANKEEYERQLLRLNIVNDNPFIQELDIFLQAISTKIETYTNILDSFFQLLFPSLQGINWNQGEMVVFRFHEKNIILSNEIFLDLQENIDLIFNTSSKDGGSDKFNVNENDSKAMQIKKDLERARERVARQNENLKNRGEKSSSSTLSNMLSTVSTRDGIDINTLKKYTFYQLSIQYNRTMLYSQYRSQMTMSAFGGIKGEDIIKWYENI